MSATERTMLDHRSFVEPTRQIVTAGPPDKPDDPTKYARRQITGAEVLRRYGWTSDDDIGLAQSLGFPLACGRTIKRNPLRPWETTTVCYYDLDAIEASDERVLRVYGRLLGLRLTT